ncbi:DUF397 domain-containing protein [Actinomadura atramentaria]|uniref:DUF397 domain-containing protein n=1 Tax=Actinomadura atramentaria TaxID=1990 RepID=UPI000A037783|nr:DUF397 domain-containing protein [Actinomadura atramentaria]
MREEKPSPVRWTKSSRCGASNTCVAVARLSSHQTVGIRDDADPSAPLFLTPGEWRDLARRVRAGEYDLDS